MTTENPDKDPEAWEGLNMDDALRQFYDDENQGRLRSRIEDLKSDGGLLQYIPPNNIVDVAHMIILQAQLQELSEQVDCLRDAVIHLTRHLPSD